MRSRPLQVAGVAICLLTAGCGANKARLTDHQAQAESAATTAGLYVWQLGYLYKVAPNGDLRLFIRNLFGFDWSPDGTRVVYASNGDGRRGALYVADAAGKHRRLLLRGKRVGEYLTNVAWSPDGTEIAFDAGSGHIYVIRPDGTGLRALTHGHQDDGGPVWSPNGKSLAFDRIVGNRTVIYVMRSNGTDQRAVIEGDEPTWSPDGKLLAFETSTDAPSRVFTVTPTGRDPKAIADGMNPAWTPDGRLSFVCCTKGYNDGELVDAYEVDLHGGSRTRLVSNLDGSTAALAWHR